METAVKKPGNPNFGKKKKVDGDTAYEDLNKQYIFQLIKTHEKQKPISAKLGDLGGSMHSPYQPYFGVINSGLAWDSDFVPKNGNPDKPGAQRRWRHLHGFPTVWVDEQIDPEPTKEDLASNLNDIIFRNGLLRVFGHEKTKLQALQLNDAFDGCKRPLKNVQKQYTLLNQEELDEKVLAALDDQFEAESAARTATPEEVYAMAFFFGIDTTQSEAAIRKEFISRARNNPAVFNKEFTNPKNKYRFVFKYGFDKNIISTTLLPGTVMLVEFTKKVWDLKTEDAIEELAVGRMVDDDRAISIYETIRKQMEA